MAAESGCYALDTEFHRERTYYPQLALVQLSWRSGQTQTNALIDTVALDRADLAESLRVLLESPAVALMHAADQDLEILELLTGTRPTKLFDTQLSAGFLGYSTPSLTVLAKSILGIDLSKNERMTDWLARPLSDAQRAYAVNDVVHLHAIMERLTDRLQQSGRLAWAEETCETLRSRPAADRDPAKAWLRVKELRALDGEQAGAGRELAKWREEQAQHEDIPPRWIMADPALATIAARLPCSTSDLADLRGGATRISERWHDPIIEAVRRGRRNPPTSSKSVRPSPSSNPAVAKILAALSDEIAHTNNIEPRLVATRADIDDFLAGKQTALSFGWRYALLGEQLERLLRGECVLSVKTGQRLQVENRPDGRP